MHKKTIIPFYPHPEKTLNHSKGITQYDNQGKRYFDFESGVWCANLGHSHPRIIKRIKNQVKKSIHHGYQFRNKLSEELAINLSEIANLPNSSSVFLSSGSEAVNLAITLAMKLTSREKIGKLDHSYLSAFGYGKIDPSNDALVSIPCNDYRALSQIDFSEMAAFVMETGGASIGIVQFPEQPFLEKIIQEAKQQGCLVIADEVTTGMGRTGRWFGYQHYSCSPDMVVTGKGLGNGYPVSGLTVAKHVLQSFQNDPFIYAQSHQNDPLGCAIGLEVIREIRKKGILSLVHKSGEYFLQKLESLRIRHPQQIREVRGRGLMLALELNEMVDGCEIHQQLFQAGFVTGQKKNTLRFMPPLIIRKKAIDLLIDKISVLLSQASHKRGNDQKGTVHQPGH
jgi:acetylornithine aminotransferase